MNNEKAKILVVDDAPSGALSLADLLSADYAVDSATDGPQALSKAIAAPPDLILLGTDAPGVDVFEVCRQLKKDRKTRSIPVIFIAPLSEELDETKGLELGAADYVTRPFRTPLLMTRVRNNIELKRRGDLLEELAMLDGLTKLPNRQHFEKVVTTEWLRGQRSQKPLSIILCDLDEFKLYNEHFGHAMGDACLFKVGQKLKNLVSRASDMVARMSGEKFAVILPATDRDGALTIGESIRSAIEAQQIPHAPSSMWKHLTLSLGVASMTPCRESSLEVLFETADKALCEARDTGRNKVVAASEFRKLFG